MEKQPPRRSWYKRLKEPLTAITAAIALLTGGVGYATSHVTYKHQIQTIQKEAAQKVLRSEAELRDLERQIDQQVAGLYAFKNTYIRHVQNLHVFSSEYRAAQTPENEDRLRVEAQSFVEFIKGWREVNEVLRPLLNGQVDRLNQALISRDYTAVHEAQQVIYSNCNEKFPMLEQKLRNLRWK